MLTNQGELNEVWLNFHMTWIRSLDIYAAMPKEDRKDYFNTLVSVREFRNRVLKKVGVTQELSMPPLP